MNDEISNLDNDNPQWLRIILILGVVLIVLLFFVLLYSFNPDFKTFVDDNITFVSDFINFVPDFLNIQVGLGITRAGVILIIFIVIFLVTFLPLFFLWNQVQDNNAQMLNDRETVEKKRNANLKETKNDADKTEADRKSNLDASNRHVTDDVNNINLNYKHKLESNTFIGSSIALYFLFMIVIGFFLKYNKNLSIQSQYRLILLFIFCYIIFVASLSYSDYNRNVVVPLKPGTSPTTITQPPTSTTTSTLQLSMDLSPFFPPVVDQGQTDICQTYDVVYYIGSYYYAVSESTVGRGTRPSKTTQANGELIRAYSDRYGSPSNTTNANLFNPLYNWLYSVSMAQATITSTSTIKVIGAVNLLSSLNLCSTGVFEYTPSDSKDAPDYEETDPQQNYNIIKEIYTATSITNGIGCITNATANAITNLPKKYDNPKVEQTYTGNSSSLSEKYSGSVCPGSPDYASVAFINKKYPFLNMKYNVLYYYNPTTSQDSTFMTVVNNATTFSKTTFLPLIKANLDAGIPLQCIISFNPTTQITNNPHDIFDSFYQRNTEVFPSVSSNCIVTRMTSSNSPNKGNNAVHSMVIVGYSEDPNVNNEALYGGGVIKFINSWGTSWGTERGFLYMSYACFFKDYTSENGIVQRINYIS